MCHALLCGQGAGRVADMPCHVQVCCCWCSFRRVLLLDRICHQGTLMQKVAKELLLL